MDQTQDFKSLQDQIQAALLATTRVSGQISSEDLGFQRSLNPQVGTALEEQTARLLELAGSLLRSAASISELQVPILDDADDVDSNWRNIVDVVDSLLEKTDICLDEYTGVIKRKETPVADQASSKSRKSTYSLGSAYRTQNLVKPQLAFEVKPDNHSTSAWKPLLTSKPHAILPLEESLGIFTNEWDQQQHRHPYETEILQLKYPGAVFKKADPVPYQPIETTSAIFVDTLDGVLEMLEELKGATEIAVDLEHHDARSYVGLVSLMQISTRQKDWIVDTLKPWRQSLQVLNQVFADPKILKVFHGAYMDIVWLQRDLGLYVVGLFDTHHASRTLGYQGGSLAFLLKKFINFDADKKYQMADWRIRPLPDEMFYYARADTHFLLNIYDNMRNELIDRSHSEVPDQNCIESVLQKSKETSLLRYERQIYNTETGKGPGGWYQLLSKAPALFNSEQLAVFRAVHEWRDKVARADDDSTAFVMPNHVIFSIAKLMPMDMVALLAIAHPISYSVKSRSGELLEVVKTSKAQGKLGPSMMDVLRHDSADAKANLLVGTVKPTPTPTPLVAIVDENHLVKERSSFWGNAFGSSIWDAATLTKPDIDLRLAVPLPQLSSDVYTTSSDLADRSIEKTSSRIQDSQPVTPASKDSNEAFVLKRGSKPQRDALSESEEAPSSHDMEVDEFQELDSPGNAALLAERQSAKLSRKNRKKAKRAESKAAEHGAKAAARDVADEEEPFDYSKAESVLHGKRKSGEQEGPKTKRPFDPYAKSADAPKGMRRVQTERAGKSYTFKS